MQKLTCHRGNKPTVRVLGARKRRGHYKNTIDHHDSGRPLNKPVKRRSRTAIHHMSNGAAVTTIECVNSATWSGSDRVSLHKCVMSGGTSG